MLMLMFLVNVIGDVFGCVGVIVVGVDVDF